MAGWEAAVKDTKCEVSRLAPHTEYNVKTSMDINTYQNIMAAYRRTNASCFELALGHKIKAIHHTALQQMHQWGPRLTQGLRTLVECCFPAWAADLPVSLLAGLAKKTAD